MADFHVVPTDSVCEAKRLPKVKGTFCSAHYQTRVVRTTTCWGSRNPTWIDEFSFDVDGPHESIRIFVLEERKRGVQKQLGEVTLSVASLTPNEVIQNSYPIIGDKGATIGELRIRATYTVDIILPTADYNELQNLLIAPGMSIVRHLSAVTKEKSTTARHLINIFQARDLAEGFIRTIVKEEIDRTDTLEVLFRGNTVCTKAMDHFMKLVGSMYQREVLMPIIEVINRETASLEVQKEKMVQGEDWKRNVARIQKLTELLLQRIFQSTNHCPPPIRNLLAYIREASSSKFPNSTSVRHTAVTSFIFLRFFVPAVLNPKLFGLTANMPDEMHMRIFTIIAGILQKLANLTKYRDLEQYINALNPFLEENFPKTQNFIDEVVAVQAAGPRTMQRRMSIANSIQIDIHLAGLVREIDACRGPLTALIDREPLIASLFTAVDKIKGKMDVVKEEIKMEEEGLSSLSTPASYNTGLDSLLSKVIQTEVTAVGNPNVVTVKRAAEEPLPDGATKARQRSGSFFSRLFSGDKDKPKKPSGASSVKISRPTGVKTFDSTPSAGARPPPSTPSSEFSRSPAPRHLMDDASSSSSQTNPNAQNSSSTPSFRDSTDSSDFTSSHTSSTPIPLSSSLNHATSSSMRLPPRPATASGDAPPATFKVGSAPHNRPVPPKPVVNQNADFINQHREQMKLRAATSATGPAPGPRAGSQPGLTVNTTAPPAPAEPSPVTAPTVPSNNTNPVSPIGGTPPSSPTPATHAGGAPKTAPKILFGLPPAKRVGVPPPFANAPGGPSSGTSPSNTPANQNPSNHAGVPPSMQSGSPISAVRPGRGPAGLSPNASPIRGRPLVSPPPQSTSPVFKLRSPSPETWFGDSTIMSDIEALEQQTDYHGLNAGRNTLTGSDENESREWADSSASLGRGNHSSDDELPSSSSSFLNSSTSSLPDTHVDSLNGSAIIATPTIMEEDEEIEEEEMDEVVVVKVDVDLAALEAEFDKLEKIIGDIQAIPLPSMTKKDPRQILPELAQLEKVVESLEEAVVFTTPKVNLVEGLSCKFCLGAIDTGSKFLVVMGQNFHEGHLNCNICSRDLSDSAFQWYKDKPYCFDCYKKGHGIRPICAHCNQPITTATYTQALGKLWHPEHFCCTVCGVGFPDGAFYNFEGKPYCPKHQNRGMALPNCGMCLMPISDPNYVEALGHKWHSHHFCCDICGIQLLGQFVTYQKADKNTGKACESHFNR